MSTYRPTFLGLFALLFVLTPPGVAFGQQTAEDFVKSGNTRMSKGDQDGSIDDYSKAIELNPKYSEAYGYRGVAENAKGDWDGAIADCNRAIDLDPKYAYAYNNRGKAKMGKGDWDGAIADCTKAIEFSPKNPVTYINRAEAKKAKGDLSGVIADYSKVIEIDPQNADAYINRGDAKRHKGDWDGAIADYSKAIEVHPEYTASYYDHSIAKVNIEFDPKYPAYCNRGIAKVNSGDWDGAIADFTKAIEINSQDADAYSYRGQAKKAKGDQAGADADFAQATKLKDPYGTKGGVFDLSSTVEKKAATPATKEKGLCLSVSGSAMPDVGTFTVSYVVVKGGKEITASINGMGNRCDLLRGDYIKSCTVQKTSDNQDWIKLEILEDGKKIFESEKIITKEPIVYEKK